MKAIILLFAHFLLLMPLAQAEIQLLDRVVAVVNDDAITQSELDFLLKPIYDQYKEEFRGEELFKRLGEIRLKLLNQLIEDRLVFQEAKDRGIEVSDAQIEKQMKEFYDKFKDEQEMELALSTQGMTLKSIRERLKKQSMIRTLHDMEIRSKVVVSPLEIQEYFDNNPEDFTQKAQVKARSLTLKKSEEARKKGLKDEEAWQRIQELRQLIADGGDFKALAENYSQDMHAENGGIGDWINRGEMIGAIDNVIFSAEVGKISEVIETKMGYHIFRVEEKKEKKNRKLEDVRDKVYAFLFQKKTEERFQQWMDELKNQSYISVR